MADNTNMQGAKDDAHGDLMATVKASHGVAHQAMQAHTKGLASLMAAMQQMHDHGMAARDTAAAGAPPQGMMGAMPDQAGGDPSTQAVWDAFPSTDPSAIDRMIQQSGSLEDAFPALAQMLEQDQQSLTDKWIQAIGDRLGAPSGDAQAAAPAMNPGVGGEATGAY